MRHSSPRSSPRGEKSGRRSRIAGPPGPNHTHAHRSSDQPRYEESNLRPLHIRCSGQRGRWYNCSRRATGYRGFALDSKPPCRVLAARARSAETVDPDFAVSIAGVGLAMHCRLGAVCSPSANVSHSATATVTSRRDSATLTARSLAGTPAGGPGKVIVRLLLSQNAVMPLVNRFSSIVPFCLTEAPVRIDIVARNRAVPERVSRHLVDRAGSAGRGLRLRQV